MAVTMDMVMGMVMGMGMVIAMAMIMAVAMATAMAIAMDRHRGRQRKELGHGGLEGQSCGYITGLYSRVILGPAPCDLEG